ncbi:MAG: copper chaperone PCu(A)C [Planctomycetota bacterium]
MRLALLLSSIFLLSACSGGEEATPEKAVTVSVLMPTHAWARTSRPPHENSAAFLQIENKGSASRRLIGASTPRAGVAELHSMEIIDDKMKMRRVDSFSIAPGETLVLKPGSSHLMFFELDSAWEEGQVIPITLEFEKGGAITIEAPVKVQ